MATELKPMDPKRLARLRDMATGSIEYDGLVDELLAAHDYHEARAEALKRGRDRQKEGRRSAMAMAVQHQEWRERAERERDAAIHRAVEAERHWYDERERTDFLARLAGSAIVRATCLEPGEHAIDDDEAIASHALTSAVDSLRARAEANAEHAEVGRQWCEDSSLAKWFPLTAERLAKAERERDENHDQILLREAQIERLGAEVARLRARVRVDAEDIERAKAAGLTGAKVRAWAKANGDFAISSGWSGEINPATFASTVRWWASEVGRPDLHVLDEMVAMEVCSDG